MRTPSTMSGQPLPEDAPLDPIMRLFEAFNADPSPKKLNLVVGVYTDANGKVRTSEITVTGMGHAWSGERSA